MFILDLHGYAIHNGWKKFIKTSQTLFESNQREFRVVTGKGKMRKEFPVWCKNCQYVESTRNENGNCGAWIVTIKTKHHKKYKKKRIEDFDNLLDLYKYLNRK
jgi:DNA-nicking Smr family endonuclease